MAYVRHILKMKDVKRLFVNDEVKQRIQSGAQLLKEAGDSL